ncbi:MAG: hypothetical protein U0930_03665 [Pirellulales bacterium]
MAVFFRGGYTLIEGSPNGVVIGFDNQSVDVGIGMLNVSGVKLSHID